MQLLAYRAVGARTCGLGARLRRSARPMRSNVLDETGHRARVDRRSRLVARAGRPPNFNDNGSFDFDSLDIDPELVRLVEESVPVLVGLLAFGFLYPLAAIPLPIALLVGVGATLGVALTSGYLGKVDRKLGISTVQSALAIIGVVFAVFAVPAVLRFAFFLLAIGAAANLFTTLVNPNGGMGSNGMGGVGSNGGFGDMSNNAYTPPRPNTKSNASSGSNVRNQGSTIDVEWESIDD